MRVLIVEDEKRLCYAIAEIMRAEKYIVDAVYNGNDGLDYAASGQYDVIILDVMLPGLSGFDVARELRRRKIATPVLMLSARSTVADKVGGLDHGADDYLTKPFATEELLARVRALGRRQGEIELEESAFDDLVLSLSSHQLSREGKSVRLSFKEFEVMRILMQNPRVIVSKDELISRVWGLDSEAEDNNVEAYISFLRKKLTYLGSRVQITTIRKVGYQIAV